MVVSPVEVIGWFGGILLALCGIPQAYKSWIDGHSEGISWWFLLMWFVGEVFVLGYVLMTGGQWPLIMNYTVNIFLAGIILWYKKYPRV